MKCGFGKQYRLLKADEYSSVFALRRCRGNPFFQLYWCPNTQGHARLGLVVAKKVARRAHERNYIKRTVREWFRQHRNVLPEADYIVRSRKKFEHSQRQEAVSALKALFEKGKTCQK